MLLPAVHHPGGPQLSTLGIGAGQARFGPHNFLSFKKACGLWGAWGTTILIRIKKDKRYNYLAACVFLPRCQSC